jgi:hypothetical protein
MEKLSQAQSEKIQTPARLVKVGEHLFTCVLRPFGGPQFIALRLHPKMVFSFKVRFVHDIIAHVCKAFIAAGKLSAR